GLRASALAHGSISRRTYKAVARACHRRYWPETNVGASASSRCAARAALDLTRAVYLVANTCQPPTTGGVACRALYPELPQQLFQLLAQLPQRHPGIAGLPRRIGGLLGQPGSIQHVAVDFLDHMRLLQGGTGDGGIQRGEVVQGLVDSIQACTGLAGLLDRLARGLAAGIDGPDRGVRLALQ